MARSARLMVVPVGGMPARRLGGLRLLLPLFQPPLPLPSAHSACIVHREVQPCRRPTCTSHHSQGIRHVAGQLKLNRLNKTLGRQIFPETFGMQTSRHFWIINENFYGKLSINLT